MSLSTSALWAIIGALLMAEVRGVTPCYDPFLLPVPAPLLGCFLHLEHDTDLGCSELSVQTKEGRDGSGKKALNRADVYNG